MANLKRVGWYAVGLVLAASLQSASASESGIRIIVLTDNAEELSVGSDAPSVDKKPGRRDIIRQQILKDIERQRREMDDNGFVVGTDASALSKGKLTEDLVRHQVITSDTYDSVLPDFAYAARNLNDSPFNKGRLLGFMPVRSDDKKIHETFWAYQIRGVGNVTVEELSYRTIPDVTIKVAEPSGNIQINGNPGTYMVMTDAKGKRGVTTIDFMTSDKLFTITAFKPIRMNSKRFKRLMKLAESLY